MNGLSTRTNNRSRLDLQCAMLLYEHAGLIQMAQSCSLTDYSKNMNQYFGSQKSKHKVFISYHHENDQYYKERLLEFNEYYQIFIDGSVDTGGISDDLDDKAIREKIRDEYLRDSTVTILLVGLETKKRKHIDWEIYSSMFDGRVNKKSGILVINLPSIKCTYYSARHKGEKERFYPNETSWITIDDKSEFESRYPYMPDRIIDNLKESEAKISVVNWNKIETDFDNLKFLINATFDDRAGCNYDLSRPMKRANSWGYAS